MNDNVIRFPGADPPVEAESQSGGTPIGTPMPKEAEAYEEWRDEEVPDFLAHAADLDGADPDEFRRVALRLLAQIDTWLLADG